MFLWVWGDYVDVDVAGGHQLARKGIKVCGKKGERIRMLPSLFVLKLQDAHLCMRLSASPSHMVAREVVEVAAGDDLALVESAASLLRHLLCCFPASWHLGGPP